MVSLLIGETSLGAVAFRFEPSAAFAKVFAGDGAGVSGVETEHATDAASTHAALHILADFSIAFSSVEDGRGVSAAGFAFLTASRDRALLTSRAFARRRSARNPLPR